MWSTIQDRVSCFFQTEQLCRQQGEQLGVHAYWQDKRESVLIFVWRIYEMKALNLLVELREVDYREFGASKEDLKVYDEAIEELEKAMKPKTCDGCAFNFLSPTDTLGY